MVGATLRCPRGHAFDRAREGYWNLLQPQDRKTLQAGDRDDAVDARRTWLRRGDVSGLVDVLASLIDRIGIPSGAAAIDVGCGEGSLTAALLGARGLDACGIDLSARAIRLAAKLDASITWIVANADRGLPLAGHSVALALSIFGRRPAAELHRVLGDGGTLIAVIPAADDLIELRQALTGEGIRRDRREDTIASLTPLFELVCSTTWSIKARHDREALMDAATMSYRGARRAERARLASVEGLDVTLAADILTLVPSRTVR